MKGVILTICLDGCLHIITNGFYIPFHAMPSLFSNASAGALNAGVGSCVVVDNPWLERGNDDFVNF